MQEFMDIQFVININRRVKDCRIVWSIEGFFIFYFPPHSKNMQQIARRYIQQNYIRMQKFLLKQQTKCDANKGLVEQYLRQYPDALIVFGTYFPVKDTSIESLSAMLYVKAEKILDEYAFKMQLNYTKLIISYAKSYLGQCDRRARIKIDYRNVLCDELLLRYLVVHELAHIRHPNHSKTFWQEVERFCPCCKAARKELKVIANRNALILKHYGLLPQALC